MRAPERAGEKKLDIGQLEDEAALEKSFEDRAAQHDERAADESFRTDDLPKKRFMAEVEKHAEGKEERGETNCRTRVAQFAEEAKRAALEQHEPEICERGRHGRSKGGRMD